MLKKGLALFLFFIFAMSAYAYEIRLPDPAYKGKMSLEETLAQRRSVRSYYPNELTLKQLSQLLWAAQGITQPKWGFRTAPSAGAIYPLYLYVVKKDGVWLYDPKTHSLKQTLKEDKRASLTRASLGQKFIQEAPVSIVITADFERTEVKYGQRAFQYVHNEAGHAAENLLLQAVAMDLGAVVVGAFWDNVAARTLDLPYEHTPIYIIPVGYAKTTR